MEKAFSKSLASPPSTEIAFCRCEERESTKKAHPRPERPKPVKTKEPFNPKRYPSFFNIKTGKGESLISLPEGEEKTVQFATDVEDNYFDRSEDPDELKVSVLQFRQNQQGAVLPLARPTSRISLSTSVNRVQKKGQ